MKANKAPKKLYLHPTAKGNVGASWLIFPITNEDIEYTRTDAFIEKACSWLEERMIGWNNDFVGEFRNYMEGE